MRGKNETATVPSSVEARASNRRRSAARDHRGDMCPRAHVYVPLAVLFLTRSRLARSLEDSRRATSMRSAVGGAASSSAFSGAGAPASTPSDLFTSARQALNSVEFQLQQLEAQDASSAPLADDDSMRRAAVSEGLRRLTTAVAALQRRVEEEYGGVAAASAKSDLWKKCGGRMGLPASPRVRTHPLPRPRTCHPARHPVRYAPAGAASRCSPRPRRCVRR